MSKLEEYLSDKQVSLQDIYKAFPDAKKESIRGCLNVLVKGGKIKRIGKGMYTHL